MARSATGKASIGANSEKQGLNYNVRASEVNWLHLSEDSRWVYDRLATVASKLNSQYYRFEISGLGEALQLTNYSINGKYGWHVDYGSTVSRKLSLTLQLTEACEYEGGELQMFTGGNPLTVRKERGLIAAFPSYTVHQVSPVTKGSRQSLVAWFSGPSFR